MCARRRHVVTGTFNSPDLFVLEYDTLAQTLSILHQIRAEGPHQYLAYGESSSGGTVYATTWGSPSTLSAWHVTDDYGLSFGNHVPITATGSYVHVQPPPYASLTSPSFGRRPDSRAGSARQVVPRANCTDSTPKRVGLATRCTSSSSSPAVQQTWRRQTRAGRRCATVRTRSTARARLRIRWRLWLIWAPTLYRPTASRISSICIRYRVRKTAMDHVIPSRTRIFLSVHSDGAYELCRCLPVAQCAGATARAHCTCRHADAIPGGASTRLPR